MWYLSRATYYANCNTTFRERSAALPPALCAPPPGDSFRHLPARGKAHFLAGIGGATGNLKNRRTPRLRSVAGRGLSLRSPGFGDLRIERGALQLQAIQKVRKTAPLAVRFGGRGSLVARELPPAAVSETALRF